MSNYTKTTTFDTKDALASGDPNKTIRGSELETEFDAIATAIATKYDSATTALAAIAQATVAFATSTLTWTSQHIFNGALTFGAAVNAADQTLSRPIIKDYAETKQDVTAAASTTIDITNGNVVKLSQDTNITTLTISNPSPTGNLCSLTIVRVKDATGTARTITWPAAVKWSSGTAPTLTQTTGCVDIISLISYDAGTTWYGTTVLDLR